MARPVRRLATADTPPPVHVALVTGRVRDALDDAGLRATVALDWRRQGEPAFRPAPASFRPAADGWFAFVARASRMPAITAADTVELRLTATIPNRDPQVVTLTEPGASFEARDRTVTTSAGDVDVPIPGGVTAPVEIAFDPLPVTLQGRVLLDHDPTTPAAGTRISIVAPVDPATATADARGRFALRLPVAATVTLRLIHPAASGDVSVRPAYPRRDQVIALSLDT